MTLDNQIGPGIYLVAGPELTDNRDAAAYLIEDDGRMALIDAGAGPGFKKIVENIRQTGLDPENLDMVIATHAHIDHIGGLADFASNFSASIVAQYNDAEAIETADRRFTAADSYGLPLSPVEVTIKLQGRTTRLSLGSAELVCLHTPPGHTPGSMSVYLDKGGLRYLFGQDIHGPFHPDFQSNLDDWKNSLEILLELNADVLGEGHYGVIRGPENVRKFIKEFLESYHEGLKA